MADWVGLFFFHVERRTTVRIRMTSPTGMPTIRMMIPMMMPIARPVAWMVEAILKWKGVISEEEQMTVYMPSASGTKMAARSHSLTDWETNPDVFMGTGNIIGSRTWQYPVPECSIHIPVSSPDDRETMAGALSETNVVAVAIPEVEVMATMPMTIGPITMRTIPMMIPTIPGCFFAGCATGTFGGAGGVQFWSMVMAISLVFWIHYPIYMAASSWCHEAAASP